MRDAVKSCFLIFAACSRSQSSEPKQLSSAAIVSIIEQGSGFDVSLQLRDERLATWHAKSVDAQIGEHVEQALARRSLTSGVIFCASPLVPVAKLGAAVLGLAKNREAVSCLPDRRNCPDVCP
jgi:hypothetical protein